MYSVEESDDRFYIAESTQGKAGKGLFAQVNLEQGDHLEIVGVVAKSRDCVSYADSHSFATSEGECWMPLGFGALVNHASNPAHENVEYCFKGEQPVFRCMRPINKDEEILTSYGAGFANVLAVYLTLDAKGDLAQWEHECEEIADSTAGKDLYEKIFAGII
tara:strand:- start:9826 stop:10311 length:486 start_codon:yes stop_codon:yes gene_type:complete